MTLPRSVRRPSCRGRAFLLAALLLSSLTAALVAGFSRARAQEIPPQPWAPWMEEAQSTRGAEAPASVKPPSLKASAANPSTLSDPEWEDLRRAVLESSALERMYSGRVVDSLSQFGYDLFARARKDAGQGGAGQRPAGAAQDTVLLNFGDRVQITFRGQRDDQKTYTVDNEGLLIVPDLAPIPAAGRSLGALRAAIESEAERLHNTQAFVSLVSVQRIDVLVVGHVATPGRQTLTAFNSVLDALSTAGGVEKTGSLRRIKLVRQGRSTIVDLYGLLIYGGGDADLTLQDGDRLIVPPVGPTVAVSGEVKRPGIYEILPLPRGLRETPQEASERLSLDEMLDLAGGVLAPGRNRFLRLEITRGGEDETTEVPDSTAPFFGDGSILVVARGVEKRSGSIELLGHTRRPGLYAIDETPRLSNLLDADGVLGEDIYPAVGVLERWDSSRLTTTATVFPLDQVLRGKFDRTLRDGDTVHLFSKSAIRALGNAGSGGEEEEPFGEGSAEIGGGALAQEIESPALRALLREQSARVRGAVREPGAWPVAEDTTLDVLLAAAGGLGLDADSASIEITYAEAGESGQKRRGGTRRVMVSFNDEDPAQVRIGPGDSVRVNPRPRRNEDKTVRISGEIPRPGLYDLTPGERLSDLLARAGGITDDAYPEGAIFSRESERKAEEARFKAAARDLERAAALAADGVKDGGEHKPDVEQLALARDLAGQLREARAVGRITVEADPEILVGQPELDILLESGDRIHIPKRPLTVRVTGEVLSPAALQFRSGKDARDYILEAGGFSFNADKGRVFVVYPDGSAQPLSVESWNHRAVMIPPGSAIVVPRDPKPFDFLDSAEKITRIVSNLALTGIWIDDIRD